MTNPFRYRRCPLRASSWVAFFLIPFCLFQTEALSAGSLDLTLHDVGIGIGDSRTIHGLRLNYRDRRLREVNGIHVTLWSPHARSRGVVRGVALGLPVTGAETLHGVGVGALGIGAERDANGILIGPLGVGAGERIRGLAFGGLGAGAGEDLEGLGFAGLGLGAGAAVHGLQIAGLGIGAGGAMTGIQIAGFGVGAGGATKGIQIAGLGVGAGTTMTGIQIGGMGVGAGEELRGINIAGVAAGSPRIAGLTLSGIVSGGVDITGLTVTGAYCTVGKGGLLQGASLCIFNRVQGKQEGFTLGVLNMARRLRGVQIGLLNHADDNPPWLRWLPLVNAHF